jgi:dTDP-4-amino-4,6-dideoxygalactose transaminase
MKSSSSKTTLQTADQRKDFLVFGSPLIEQPEMDEVLDTLRSGWLGTGPKVAKFEQKFGQYVGSKFALAVNSCTAGLHLSMLAAGVGPGDEVITTPMTFCATVNSIVHTGAKPVLVDCDRETQLIDPQRIVDAITPRTRALVPVHLCGRPCDMDSIMDIARKHNLVVIEDAAHAIESKYKARKIGNIAHMTAFSFYVTKNVVTGEGGMVTTNDPDLADKIKVYGLHGLSRDAWKRFSDEGYKHYQVVYPGFKYNMMDIQAAIGLHQLDSVDRNLRRRNEIWRIYNREFQNIPVGLPAADEPNTVHARHLYTLMIDKSRSGIDRDTFMQRMQAAKIGTGVHYVGVHLQPFYRETFGYNAADFPNATWISERTVSIPLGPKLTDDDVSTVVEAVKNVLLN